MAISNFFAKITPKTPANSHVKPPNHLTPLLINNICMKECFTQSAIMELEERKAESPAKKGQGFLL